MTEATLRLSDIVFSCCVCHALLSEIYGGEGQPLGLDRVPITKLYLTECAHVVCAKHFAGGGAPFHAENTLPEAVCPYCRDKNYDHRAKQLYGIRGLSQGEHDPHIPQAYFNTPPEKLNNPDMDAIRFQYASILRFAQTAYAKLILAQSESTRSINHLQSVQSTIVEHLKRARNVLQLAGHDITWLDEVFLNQSLETGNESSVTAREQQRSPSSDYLCGEGRLGHGSAFDLESLSKPLLLPGLHTSTQQRAAPLAQHPNQSRSEKRKRLDTSGGQEPAPSRNDNLRGNNKNVSRDAMPPPQFPVRAAMPIQAHVEAIRSSNDGRVTAWNPSVSNQSLNSQHGTTPGPKGTFNYLRNPSKPESRMPRDSREDQRRAAKLPKHTQPSTHYKTMGQEQSYANAKPSSEDSFMEQTAEEAAGRMRRDPVEEAAERVRRDSALRRIRDHGGFVEDVAQKRDRNPHYYPRTVWNPQLFFSASGQVTTIDPRGPSSQTNPVDGQPVPGRIPRGPSSQINPVGGQPVPGRKDDGELDSVLHQSIPQPQMSRPQNISPTRGRITLPSTPRNTGSSSTRGQVGGRPPGNQTSLITIGLKGPSASSHRQQLGQPSSTGPVAQSPYFASRNPSPERPPLRQSHAIAQPLPGPSRLNRTPAPLPYPSGHETSPQRQNAGMASSETDVSYLGQLAILHENSMGRRRARR